MTAGRDDAYPLAFPLLTDETACQFALMAVFALVFVIPVVYRECQSDDSNDNNDDLVCSHGLITPLCNKEGQSQAPSVSFLPGALLRHYSSIYVAVTSMLQVPPPRRDRDPRHARPRPRNDVRPRLERGKIFIHQRHHAVFKLRLI